MDYFIILNFFLLYILLFIIIGLILIYFIYKIIISFYSKNYDNFIKILRNVKNNNLNYMNFGYWDEDNINLTRANEKLCDYVYNQLSINNINNIKKIKNSNDNNKILDIGCGYGEQDFYWNKKYKCEIIALDISEKQINYAINKAIDNNNNNNNKEIKFLTGNACNLPFPNNSFKYIINLESAFNYNPRIEFFKEAYRVLEVGGELIIADIVLANIHYGFLKNLSIKIFKELLNVPNENLITSNQYIYQLKEIGFSVSKKNISDKTFKPYFINFINNLKSSYYFTNKICTIITNNIDEAPFNYYVFKCKKLNKNK